MITAAYLIIAAAIVLYAILAGADAGIGVWLLVARRSPHRHEIERVLLGQFSPLWEANGLFLIFALTGMFTAFPQALGELAPALAPLLVPLLALIVIRGGAYTLTHHRTERVKAAALLLFAISGTGIGLLGGYTALALPAGAIHHDTIATGYLTSAGSIASIAFVLSGMAYGAATATIARAPRHTHASAQLRRAAIASGIALLASTIAELSAIAVANPSFANHAQRFPAIALLVGMALLTTAVFFQANHRPTRGAAVGALGALILGLGTALAAKQYIAYPAIALPRNPAGNPIASYLIATAIGGPLLLGALALLYANLITHSQAAQHQSHT